MHQSFRRFLLPLLALSLSHLSSPAATLRIRADSWMPFNGVPNAKLPGYAVEIAQAIFAAEGDTVDYQTMPWSEALATCAKGEIDAVIGANQTEAAGLVVPKQAIGSPRVGLFILKGNPWRYENLGSLTKQRLGVIADYKYYDSIDSYIEKRKEPQVQRLGGESPLKDGIARLVAGDLDLLVEVCPVFNWTARAGGYKAEQFRLAYVHDAEPVYLAFAPTEAGRRYAAIFDAGLLKLRKEGRLAEILRRYGQEDWK